GGKQRETGGRGGPGHPHVVEGTLGSDGQSTVTGILEFFDADGQRNINSARGNRVYRSPERLTTGGTHVLDTSDRNTFQTQRRGCRQRRVTHVYHIDTGTKPRGFDLLFLDSSILDRFAEGF